MKFVTLNNGVKMPILGYGVYQVDPKECERCVSDALEVGYRLIDTAQAYYNEEGVGAAISNSGIPRKELFLTTKVWITNAGYEKAKASIEESLKKLKTDYIDLLLIHQPIGDYYGTYRAMEEAYEEGILKAIGVSNFYPDRFVDISNFVKVQPAVNQIETHPFQQQKQARKYLDKYHTQIESWAVCRGQKRFVPESGFAGSWCKIRQDRCTDCSAVLDSERCCCDSEVHPQGTDAGKFQCL